jgi:hypothetical protein
MEDFACALEDGVKLLKRLVLPRGRAPSTAFDGDVHGGWRGVTVPGHRSSPCSMLRAVARGGLGRVGGVNGEAMFVRGWADDVGSLKDGMLVRGGEKQG